MEDLVRKKYYKGEIRRGFGNSHENLDCDLERDYDEHKEERAIREVGKFKKAELMGRDRLQSMDSAVSMEFAQALT